MYHAAQFRPVAAHIIGTNLDNCVEESETLLPCSLCVTHFKIALHVAVHLQMSIIHDSVSVWRVQTRKLMLLQVKTGHLNIGLKHRQYTQQNTRQQQQLQAR